MYWPPPRIAGINGTPRIPDHRDELAPDTFNQRDDDLAEIFGPDRTILNTEDPQDTDAADSVSSSETECSIEVAGDDILDSIGAQPENYSHMADLVSIDDHSSTERYDSADNHGHYDFEDSSGGVGYYDSGHNDEGYYEDGDRDGGYNGSDNYGNDDYACEYEDYGYDY